MSLPQKGKNDSHEICTAHRLGRFGWQMAEKLQELRHEVLAVDREESRVNDILPW